MERNGAFRIQADAAEALAEWKAFFAQQVALKAKELARHGSPPGLITLNHYRQAAVLAAQSLAIESGMTIIINPEEVAGLADKFGISIVAVNADELALLAAA